MMTGAALVLYQQIDIVVISWAADSEDVGWYATADVLFGSLLFPATVVTTTIFPSLGRLHLQDPAGLTDLAQRTFSALIIVAVPIGVGTALVAPTFAPLLYGEDFRETGTVLAIFGPVIILTYSTILFGALAQATDRVRLWFWVLLISALMTVPLDIVLVPWARDHFGNGAIGGAIAFVITETVQFAIGLWTVARFLVRRNVIWRVLRILAAGGVMFLVGWQLRDVLLPVLVLLCATVYGLLVLLFRVLTDNERRLIDSVLQRFGVRSSWSN
jgi:O-antigen/teichoic acid export membrane protein